MWNFKRDSLKTNNTATVITSECKSLLSFDYKYSGAGGNANFRFKYCGSETFTEYLFTGLVDTGGIFFTYTVDPDVGDPVMCIEQGSFEWVSGTVSNVNAFVYSAESCVL